MFIVYHLIFSGFDFMDLLLHPRQPALDLTAQGQLFPLCPDLAVDLRELLINFSLFFHMQGKVYSKGMVKAITNTTK